MRRAYEMLAVTGVALLLLTGGQAAAQDFQPSSWTGFYIGAAVGAGSINHKLGFEFDGDTASLDGIGGEGFIGSLQAGADFQASRSFVVGAFVDYDFSGIESEASGAFFGDTAGGTVAVDGMWTVGARLGLLASPDTLWYAGAGYSRLMMGDAEGFFDNEAGSYEIPDFSGYSLLAGAETRFTNNLSVKLEYRFSQFQSQSRAIEDATISLEPSLHTGRV